MVLLYIRQLLSRQLAEDGYAGIEVRVTPVRTEIIIKATRTQDVLGEKGQRIRELTSVVQKRCNRKHALLFLTSEFKMSTNSSQIQCSRSKHCHHNANQHFTITWQI